MARLSPKQEAFVAEYIKDLNATQAAIRAGYSPKGADATAARLLVNVRVAEAVAKAKQDRAERAQVDAQYVLNRLVEIDQLDVADLLNEDGSVKAVKDWPLAWRRSISGLDVLEVGGKDDLQALVKKLRLPDKLRNLELLGKHVGVQAWGDKTPDEDTPMEPIRFVIEDARADAE